MSVPCRIELDSAGGTSIKCRVTVVVTVWLSSSSERGAGS